MFRRASEHNSLRDKYERQHLHPHKCRRCRSTSEVFRREGESLALNSELETPARQAAQAGGTISAELKTALTDAAEKALAAKAQMNALGAELKATQGSGSGLNTIAEGLTDLQSALGGIGIAVGAGALSEFGEQIVETAEKFGIANAQFAAQIGISDEAAAGLGAALTGVGANTDAYATMVLNSSISSFGNMKTLNSLGMATRDSNGALLSGQQLMDSAISTMQQFKAGTDQTNSRSMPSGAVQKKSTPSCASPTKRSVSIFPICMNLASSPVRCTAASANFEEALARQHQRWQDIEIAVGQNVLPALTKFVNWINTDGTNDLKVLESALFSALPERGRSRRH